MGRSHDAGVVGRHICEDLVEFHILLGMCVDEIMKLEAGNREHGGTVQLGIVKTIQEVDAARSRSGDTDAKLARQLRISCGRKCRSLLMTDLHKLQILPALSEGLDDAVDSVAGDAEDDP